MPIPSTGWPTKTGRNELQPSRLRVRAPPQTTIQLSAAFAKFLSLRWMGGVNYCLLPVLGLGSWEGIRQMTSQPNLFEPVAHARRTDPPTSHAAAASVRGIRESQADVLTVIRKYGPVSDEQISSYYRDLRMPRQSESGLRTRRSELVTLGLVVDSGLMGYTLSNRKTVLWKVK